jgi:DNA helicase HerA-like ATPase
MELKSDKNSLLVRLNDDKEGNGVIDYQTGDNTTVIREQYRNANISEISYNTNRDNRITVIEYYSAESRYPDIRKLDTNGDGFIDMMEEDKNHDGIIDTNELQVNMEGMFIPFSTFSVIIM